MEDYYKILGITDDERRLQGDEFEKVLKKKFRALCLQYHPDRQVGKSDSEKKEAEDRFKEVNEAYSVLSDSQKRMQYDMYGSVGGPGGMGDFGGMDDLSDFMRRHMENMGFGGMGGFGMGSPMPQNGSDIRVRVECSLEDIYRGAGKKLKYNRQVKCPDCGGSGSADGKVSKCPHCNGTGMETKVTRMGFTQMVESHPCPHCGGSGKAVTTPCGRCGGSGLVSESEIVEFSIPRDIRDGYVLNVQGKGNESPEQGGMPGKLKVTFAVARHPMFTVADNMYDLMCKTDVGVLDCITGCTREVSTIGGGKATIVIPAGAKDGTAVTVKRAGMPTGDGTFADMVVYVNQVMPTSLDKDERKAIDKLSNMKHFKAK